MQLSHASVDHGTLGFSLELYTYLTLCNALVMPPTSDHRLHANAIIMPLDKMAGFPTFGSLFAGSQDLYRLIPEVGQLAAQRLAEEAAGEIEPSTSLTDTRDRLYDSISAFEMPPPSWPGERDRDLKGYASEALRHALHVYLITSIAGSVVSGEKVRSCIGQHTAQLFWYIRALADTHYFATLLWPVAIGASCITKPTPQEHVTRVFRDSWSGMRHMGILAEILQLLWKDPDPRAYGPYGLAFIMKKHGKLVGLL